MSTTKRRSTRNRAPKVDPETYEVGTWSGVPNFGCPFCDYRSLAGTAEIVTHIAFHHRDQAIAQAEQEAS